MPNLSGFATFTEHLSTCPESAKNQSQTRLTFVLGCDPDLSLGLSSSVSLHKNGVQAFVNILPLFVQTRTVPASHCHEIRMGVVPIKMSGLVTYH